MDALACLPSETHTSANSMKSKFTKKNGYKLAMRPRLEQAMETKS
jgi:hypothetical protein